MRRRSAVLGAFLAALAPTATAWNLDAKYINALRFEKDGRIQFTLFNQGWTGAEFLCGAAGTSSNQWFTVAPCPGGDAACLAGVNRMASMLLSAKLAGKPVHVQRDVCDVTEVALKP